MAGGIMKKILFYPLCLIMSSCFIDDNTASSSTQSLSKICDELNKYYDNLSETDQESKKEQLSKIFSVLSAAQKICNAEKNNLTLDKQTDAPNNIFINLLNKNNNNFNQDAIADLMKKEVISKKNATEIFLDLYEALYKDSEKKNVFTKINDDKIEQDVEHDKITISKKDVQNFKSKNNKDTIYVSDLINNWFNENGFALLKNRKYLVVDIKGIEGVLLENKDKTEVFEHSLLGGTIIKFVCGIFPNGAYLEKSNVFTNNVPKFLKTNQIEKQSEVVCLYSLEKVSDAKLESLIEDE